MHTLDELNLDGAPQFVESMLSTFDDDPVPGFIAAHFHLSADGGEMLNYAEWSSSQAYTA